MTNPISNSSGWAAAAAGSTSGPGAGGTPAAGTGAPELDRQAFLKLLIAQLKYQDPNSPVDNSQFITQTAQFTMVDKLSAIETSQRNLLLTQVTLQANSLVGRTVSYVNEQGQTVSGIVRSASFHPDSSPILRIGDTDVPLSSVTEVRTTAG